MKKQNEEINLKDLIGIFIPKLWIILVVSILLSAVLGAHAMFLQQDTYTSKASIMVSKSNSTSINASDIDLSSMVIENLEAVIFSSKFMAIVGSDIELKYGYSLTPKYLNSVIKLTPNGKTATFDITVTTDDAEKSWAIAEAVTEHIMGETLFNILPENFGVITMSRYEDPGPGAKNGKGVVTKLLIGFLIGAVVSMVVIYVITIFDVVIHDRKKIEDNFDLPVLGVIPRYDIEEPKTKVVTTADAGGETA